MGVLLGARLTGAWSPSLSFAVLRKTEEEEVEVLSCGRAQASFPHALCSLGSPPIPSQHVGPLTPAHAGRCLTESLPSVPPARASVHWGAQQRCPPWRGL